MKIVRLLSLLLILCITRPAQAQVETIGAVLVGLQAALSQLQQVIAQAGSEVKSAGNSLQANGQNLVTDINNQILGKLSDDIDKLSGAERQMADDAIALTTQINAFTRDAIHLTASQARFVLGDGDIVAYDALYALPCREKAPRVVYVNPESIKSGAQTGQIRIRGNYLNLTSAKSIKIDGTDVIPASWSATDIVAVVPSASIERVHEPIPISISIPAAKRGAGFLCGIFGSQKTASVAALSASVTIIPKTRIDISGQIAGDFQGYDYLDPSVHLYNQSEDCDASYDWDQNQCLPADYELIPTNMTSFQKVSANCNSVIGDPTPSGNRCVFIHYHVGGCGYSVGVFGIKIACKGRGWVDSYLQLHGRKTKRVPMQNFTIAGSGDGSQTSFSFPYPNGSSLTEPHWNYQVTVVESVGPITTKDQLGSGNPNGTVATTRIDPTAGIVYVTMVGSHH
jgi:hypothetical protein